MTPGEHITCAEQLLDSTAMGRDAWPEETVLPNIQAAIAHALIALAVELGAPHLSGPPGPAGSG